MGGEMDFWRKTKRGRDNPIAREAEPKICAVPVSNYPTHPFIHHSARNLGIAGDQRERHVKRGWSLPTAPKGKPKA